MKSKTTEELIEEIKRDGIYVVLNNRLQHLDVEKTIEEENRFLIICNGFSTHLYKDGAKPQTFGELGKNDIIYRAEFSADKPITYSEVKVKGVYEAESKYSNDLIEVIIDDPKEPKSCFEKSFKINIDAASTRMMGVTKEGVVVYVVTKEAGEKIYNNFMGMVNNC